jgi:hypothetical protein
VRTTAPLLGDHGNGRRAASSPRGGIATTVTRYSAPRRLSSANP